MILKNVTGKTVRLGVPGESGIPTDILEIKPSGKLNVLSNITQYSNARISVKSEDENEYHLNFGDEIKFIEKYTQRIKDVMYLASEEAAQIAWRNGRTDVVTFLNVLNEDGYTIFATGLKLSNDLSFNTVEIKIMSPYICNGLIIFNSSLIEQVKEFFKCKCLEEIRLCITSEENLKLAEYKDNHLELHFIDSDCHLTHYTLPDNVSVYLKEINTLYTFKGEHDMRHALLTRHPIDATIVYKEDYEIVYKEDYKNE